MLSKNPAGHTKWVNFHPYQWWLNLRTDVCPDGSQGVNNGQKPDPLLVLPLNFVQNLRQPVTLLDS